MDGAVTVIENVTGCLPFIAEKPGKTVPEGLADTGPGLLKAPWLKAEGFKRYVQRVMNYRPGIDQSIIPIKQDGPWFRLVSAWGRFRRHGSVPGAGILGSAMLFNEVDEKIQQLAGQFPDVAVPDRFAVDAGDRSDVG